MKPKTQLAPRPKTVVVKVKKKGAPAWMVSFGDMMTLILCFFILLVSMADERDNGRMAKGLGSFVISIRSMGLSGVMSGAERQRIFDEMRRKFNLPPEEDPERRPDPDKASTKELVRADAVAAMRHRPERTIPQIAAFAPGSTELLPASHEHLKRVADLLRPRRGELLVLEGHAADLDHNRRKLSEARAEAVQAILVSEYAFDPELIEIRTWFTEPTLTKTRGRSVDARLILPNTTD